MKGLRNILLEGRIEDARQYIENSIGTELLSDESEEVLGYFIDGDPSGNHKYLMWMVKMHDTDSGFSPNMLIDVVQRFHKNVDKIHPALVMDMGLYSGSRIAISPKNIDSYPDYRSLKGVVEAAEESVTRKEREVQAKEGANKIYEDERWMVIRPDTQDASCYYGAGTKWCTAMKNQNHFDNYTSKGRLYYLIDKSRNLGKYYKIAAYKPFVGDGGDEWYDEKDNRIEGEIYEVVSSLLPQAAHDEIERDFQKELDDAYDQHSSPTQFAEKFIEWVQRKFPEGKDIETLSGPWLMEAMGDEDSPGVIMFQAREYEALLEVSIFDPRYLDGDTLEFVMDADEFGYGPDFTPIRLKIGTRDFDQYFWNFNENFDTISDSDYQRFYNQLIRLVTMEYFDTQELVDAVDLDKKYWKHDSYSGKSLKFHYPPRKGTMTQLFTDYVRENPGKTRQEFYRDVLQKDHTRGHNTTFFGGLLSSGIVRGERGPGRGRATKFYVGPNYDAWIKGNLKRI
jgi:hypothetical protein